MTIELNAISRVLCQPTPTISRLYSKTALSRGNGNGIYSGHQQGLPPSTQDFAHPYEQFDPLRPPQKQEKTQSPSLAGQGKPKTLVFLKQPHSRPISPDLHSGESNPEEEAVTGADASSFPRAPQNDSDYHYLATDP